VGGQVNKLYRVFIKIEKVETFDVHAFDEDEAADLVMSGYGKEVFSGVVERSINDITEIENE
jgi:hypothetical protein